MNQAETRVKPISVFACESQPIVIEGLRSLLDSCLELEFAGAAEPGEAMEAIAGLRPDVVLVGHAPGPDSAQALLAKIGSVSVGTRPVLWVSDPDAIDASRALELGARGVIRKNQPTAVLLECLRSVAAGQLWFEDGARPEAAPARPPPRLTPREGDIVRLLCRGLSNKEIAQELAIAPGTVKVHLMHVFEKTGTRNRYELAVRSRRWLSGQALPE